MNGIVGFATSTPAATLLVIARRVAAAKWGIKRSATERRIVRALPSSLKIQQNSSAGRQPKGRNLALREADINDKLNR